MNNSERIERFKAEAAELNVKTGNPNKEGILQIVGLLLMAGGIVAALVAYSASLSMSAVDVQSTLILAIAMLGVSVSGAAIFLRYSIAKFLRFWLLRQIYEGQSHVDQVVDALANRSSESSLTSTRS